MSTNFALILIFRFMGAVNSGALPERFPDVETCQSAAKNAVVELGGVVPVPTPEKRWGELNVGYACVPVPQSDGRAPGEIVGR